MSSPLALSTAIQNELVVHARSQWPHEACGWIVRGAVRRADNIAPSVEKFSFAAADLLAFATECDGANPPIALYHSHPNGDIHMSAADLNSARTAFGPAYPVAQVIVAGAGLSWRIAAWTWNTTQQTYTLSAQYSVDASSAPA